MAEEQISLAFVQEPHLANIQNSTLVTGISGGLNAFYAVNTHCRALLIAQRSVKAEFVPELSNSDCCVIQAVIDGKLTTIVSAYFDITRDIQVDLDQLDRIMQRVKSKRIIIHADSNARHSVWFDSKVNKRGTALVNWLSTNNLVCMNQKDAPTFDSPVGQSTIDITLADLTTSRSLHDWHVVSSENSLSDHNYIRWSIGPICESKTISGTRKFATSKANWSKFAEVFNEKVTDTSHCNSTVDDASYLANLLTATCSDSAEQSMPKLDKTATRNSKLLWWDKEVIRARSLKNRASKFAKHAHDDCKEEAKNFAKIVLNYYKNLLLTKSAKHWHKFTRGLTNQTMYKTLKNLQKDQTKSSKILKSDGSYYGNDDEVAIAMAVKLAGEESEKKLHHHSLLLPTETLSNAELHCLIKEAIRNLSDKKAPGVDGIAASILANAFQANPDIFVSCFGKCLANSIFPDIWKKGVVCMIPKPTTGEKTISSFRPITLLPLLGKVLERIMVDKITDSIENGCGFNTAQYGFRKGKSTLEALLDLSKHVNGIASRKRASMLLSLDITAAFDSASWPDIVESMRKMKIPEQLVQLSISFFSNREITVAYNGALSPPHVLTRGCPQGSVTGPLMWLILFDSLLNKLSGIDEKIRCFAFADDLLVVIEAGNTDLLKTRTESVLEVIGGWSEEKGLIFNPKKTQCLLRKPKKSHINFPTLKMGDTTLIESDSLKYLGVTIQSNWKWYKHVENAKNKATKRLFACMRIAGRTWGLSKTLRFKLYRTVYLPTLFYAAPLWAKQILSTDKGKKMLSSIQRKALIWCTSSYHSVSNNCLLVLADQPDINIEMSELLNRFHCSRSSNGLLSKPQLRKQMWERIDERRFEHVSKMQLHPNIKGMLKEGRISQNFLMHIDYWSTQLITGHGGLNAYLYKIGKAACSCCPCDNTSQQDNTHVIFDCKLVDKVRTKSGLNRLINLDRTIEWNSSSSGKIVSLFAKDALRILDRTRKRRSLVGGANCRCNIQNEALFN
jgi:hypothetical protein